MKKYFAIIPLVFSLVLLSGCEDYLVEDPEHVLIPEEIEDSEAGATLLVNGVLNTINDGPMFRYGAFPNVLEYDQDHVTGPDWALGGLGAGNLLGDWFSDYPWTGPYTLVHRANFAMYYIRAMTFDEAAKNNAIGQLQFLKAWGYFLLVRAYGPIPLFEKSIEEEGQSAQQERQPISTVYEEIIELLVEAEANMYSVQDDQYSKGELSSGAASALLAKVYLTMASGSLSGATVTVMGGAALDADKNRIAQPVALTHTKDVVDGYENFNSQEYFTKARDKAKQIMESGDYALFSNYMDVWSIANRNSVEHIWSLQALSGDDVLGNQINLYFRGYENTDGSIANGGWIGVREHWYELFDDSKDERVTKDVLHRWSQYGYAHYYPAKHADNVAAKDPLYGYDGTEIYTADNSHIARLRKYEFVTDRTIQKTDIHYPFLRYADVLLMFAEAENEINSQPTAAAYEALNQVRTRSKADAAPSSLNQQQFRSYVLEERGRELALEANRRWDLIRWGIYLQVMNAVDVDENNIVKRRSEKHLLYPIPVSEINANIYINENNPGW